MEDYYDILQCSPHDATDTIKRKYQQLVLQLHPDKLQQKHAGGGATTNASTAIKGDACFESRASHMSRYHLVQRAWQVLSDEALRKEYDARWSQRMTAQQWPLQEEVCFEDFDEDEDKSYTYQCRCGGLYRLSHNDVSFKVDLVCCSFCSLCIKISYDELSRDSQKLEDT